MTGYVGWLNIRVVSDPAMPVATANTRSHNLGDYAMYFGSWVRNIL
jgi:hypothetical protein